MTHPTADDPADAADDLTERERDAWRRLAVSAISDCLGRHRVVSSRLRTLSGAGLLGRAFCVRTMPGDSASLHLALDHVPPGRILVVDAGGYPDRAVWGELLTAAAEARGVRGLVLDGAVRDIAAIRARRFPVYALATCPAGPHKSGGGQWGGTVSCGGTAVDSGDLVVADEDGVAAVPWGRRHEVMARARDRMATEAQWLEELNNGRRSAELLGLDRWEQPQ